MQTTKLCSLFAHQLFFVEMCSLSVSSDGEQHKDELTSSIQAPFAHSDKVSTHYSCLNESIEWTKVDF